MYNIYIYILRLVSCGGVPLASWMNISWAALVVKTLDSPHAEPGRRATRLRSAKTGYPSGDMCGPKETCVRQAGGPPMCPRFGDTFLLFFPFFPARGSQPLREGLKRP